MSFIRIRNIVLAGAFVAATSVGAQAALNISSAVVVADPTQASLAALGFNIINLGSGPGSGAVSTGAAPTLPNPLVVGGLTIGYTQNSGVYVGDQSGVTRSPIRPVVVGGDNPYYLNAQAGSGSVVISFAPTTSFALLWGSVDNNPVNYNLVQITAGGVGSVNGAQIVTAATGGSVTVGTTNLAVVLTSSTPFSQLTFTATNQAFEFIPVSVPEPASLALLGAGLLGLGFAARRRRGE